MKNIAIIIDDRPSARLDKVVEDHMKYLDGWHLKRIHHIPIKTPHDYNRILLDVDFWKNLLDYENVLIFQHDSMILRRGIEEFLGYDFIGAPIHPDRNFPFPAMNGGLSLRAPQAMIDCLTASPYATTKYKGHNEDIYFSNICGELGLILPTFETACKFSVETIFGLGSFGVHNISSYLTIQECSKILQYQYEQG